MKALPRNESTAVKSFITFTPRHCIRSTSKYLHHSSLYYFLCLLIVSLLLTEQLFDGKNNGWQNDLAPNISALPWSTFRCQCSKTLSLSHCKIDQSICPLKLFLGLFTLAKIVLSWQFLKMKNIFFSVLWNPLA